MKRRYYIGFLLIQLLLPACLLIGIGLGGEFVLAGEMVYLILVSAGSVLLTVGIWKTERSFLAIPAVFLAIVNSVVLLFNCSWQSVFAVLLLPLCGWLVLVRMPKGWPRVVLLILNGCFTVMYLMSLPMMLFGKAMSSTTVVMEVDSPRGAYTAVVEDVDQGALGGDTLVRVRDNDRTVNIGIGSFVPSRYVYYGDWGEWQDMELYWQEEAVLVINGMAYSASAEDMAAIGNIADVLNVEIWDGVLLKSEDSHGGFLGDGLAYAEVQCSMEVPDSEYWHELPLSDTLAALVSRNGLLDSIDGRCLAPPEIRNGYYFFMDEFDGTSPDDSQVRERYSYNFTLALYDADTGILYYYELDT